MLNAWDLEHWGCRIFRLLEIGEGGGGTILGIWNVWDVECLSYEMFWI